MQTDNFIKLTGYIVREAVPLYEGSAGLVLFTYLRVPRKKGRVDILPIHLTQEHLSKLDTGAKCYVEGILYTRSVPDGHRLRVELAVMVSAISNDIPSDTDSNYVVLTGRALKSSGLRKTPRGIDVCDTILEVSVPSGRAYIPVVGFWDNAVLMGNVAYGNSLKIEGNLQNRDYDKVVNGVSQKMTTYEVAVRYCTVP